MRLLFAILPRRAGGGRAIVSSLRSALAVAVLLASAASASSAADSLASLPLGELNRLFAAKDFAGVEALCRKLRIDHPSNAEVDYELACAVARQGRADEAIAELTAAGQHGFTDAARAQGDDDLSSLRARADFKALLAGFRSAPIGAGEPDEPGADLDGVGNFERQPQSGLRYRLRLGVAATASHPHRLVLWLHPSGGSGDALVEPLAPELAKHGFALVVFPRKQYLGWSDQELAALRPTIADLGKVPGVDATRPILMGFSAGGQAALLLWQATPQAWGGLALDAAYPIAIDRATNRATPIQLTAAETAAHTPILAIVGGDDGNLPLWTQAEPAWSKAGLPVRMTVVKGRKHEFLFSGDVWKATLEWLDQIQGAKRTAR